MNKDIYDNIDEDLIKIDEAINKLSMELEKLNKNDETNETKINQLSEEIDKLLRV